MAINFNRQSVGQVWEQKSARRDGENSSDESTPTSPLGQALADNKLSSEEYDDLKNAFLKEHPGQDFEAFLADALDGSSDNRTQAELKGAVERLSSH